MVLYAYGEVLVRSGECNFRPILFFPKTEGSHIYLCAVEGMHGKIRKTMRGNKRRHTN